MALHRNTAALLAVAGGLAALLAASQPAMGCGVSGYSVGGNLNSLETPTLNPDGSYQRYAVSSACVAAPHSRHAMRALHVCACTAPPRMDSRPCL